MACLRSHGWIKVTVLLTKITFGIHKVSVNTRLGEGVMHLSVLCPTNPRAILGGTRWVGQGGDLTN